MLDRVALLANRELGGIGLGIDRKPRRRARLQVIDEEFELRLGLAFSHASGEEMEAAFFELGSDELGVVHVEASEGEAVTRAPPDGVVVVEAAPESFVFLTVTQVAEEGIHVLEADALRVDLDHRDPRAARTADESVERRLVMADQFLLAERERRARFLHDRRQARGRLGTPLRLADEGPESGGAGLVGPLRDATLRVQRDALARIEIHHEAGRRDFGGDQIESEE